MYLLEDRLGIETLYGEIYLVIELFLFRRLFSIVINWKALQNYRTEGNCNQKTILDYG